MLVVSNEHYENLYDLPPELGTPIQRIIRDVALGFKATYDCTGVSTRQHNEPDGNQDVWHYHVHVFPRFRNDNLYVTGRGQSTREERRPYATKLRTYLDVLHRTDICPGGGSVRSVYGWVSEKGRNPGPTSARTARFELSSGWRTLETPLSG